MEGLRKRRLTHSPSVGIMLGREVRRERMTKDTGEDELEEHMEGCDEERIGKRKAIGREHPFAVERE